MKSNAFGTGLLRVILVPLLCAFIALSGIAAARANGARLADPDRLAKIALCLPSGLPADEAPHDHDCDACVPVVPAAIVPQQPTALSELRRITPAQAPDPGLPLVSGSNLLPWSRGPPAAA